MKGGVTWLSTWPMTHLPSLASFPGFHILQILMTCSMEKWREGLGDLVTCWCDVKIIDTWGQCRQRISRQCLVKKLKTTTFEGRHHSLFGRLEADQRKVLSYNDQALPCPSTLCLPDIITCDQISQAFPSVFLATVLINLPPLQTLPSGLKTKCIGGQNGEYKSLISLLSTSQHWRESVAISCAPLDTSSSVILALTQGLQCTWSSAWT